MESTWEYCVTKPLDCWLFSGLSRKLNTSQTVSSVCVLHVLPLSYSTLKFQTLGHLGLKYQPRLIWQMQVDCPYVGSRSLQQQLGNWCRLLEILRWEYGEKWKCVWQFPSKTSNNKQNHLTQKDGVYDSPMSFAAFSFMTAVMAESWLCSLRWWTQTCFCLRNLGMETGGKNANVVLQGCSCYSRFQIECSWALKHWVLQWEIKDSDSRWQLGVDCSSRDRGRRFWKFNMAQCRLQPKSIQSSATVSTSKAKRLNLMFVYLNLT